jgi:hypothetical protein
MVQEFDLPQEIIDRKVRWICILHIDREHRGAAGDLGQKLLYGM